MTRTPKQKALQRDRETIRAEIKILTNPKSPQSDRAKAVEVISTTVLKGTGQSADAETPAMLANLAAALADSGTVGLLGIKDAIKLNTSAETAASIPEKVVTRLNKLV